MAGIVAREDLREAVLEAVVIRADGTREDLGAVAYYHRNPLRRLAWRLMNRTNRGR